MWMTKIWAIYWYQNLIKVEVSRLVKTVIWSTPLSIVSVWIGWYKTNQQFVLSFRWRHSSYSAWTCLRSQENTGYGTRGRFEMVTIKKGYMLLWLYCGTYDCVRNLPRKWWDAWWEWYVVFWWPTRTNLSAA